MNPNSRSFQKRLIASVVASSALAGFSGGAMAQSQDDAMLEEIVVTGIRGALERAMDVKRDSSGVVDAISAEDIGKFPDTNLAESLQRITGVSIDRKNGEGSQITVRGFGPGYNMVTLNGRTLPTGSAYGGSAGTDSASRGGNSRAFDFANLSADAVSGVEVYKTSKANIATGGIGATVNVKTSKPLATPGFDVSVGAKALHDTTNRTGDDVTPEVSGIFSWSDESGVFGVSLSASHSERDSGMTQATVNDWDVDEWGSGDTQTIYDNPANSDIFQNEPEAGQLYARPFDVRYATVDRQRERTNAQLTVQFKPIESLTASLDYTFAQTDQSAHRSEATTWVQNGGYLTDVEFDDSAIKTPTFIREDYGDDRFDFGAEQQYRAQEDTLESAGLNLDWEVNDQLTLVFDAHSSTMESLPTGPGHSGQLSVGVGSSIKSAASWQFSGHDIPSYTNTFDTSNGSLQDNLSSSVMRVWSAEQRSEVDQAKLDAHWEFDDGSRFDFGIERREMSSNTIDYNTNANQVLGGWGASAPGEFPDGSFEPYDITGEFEDPSTGNSPPLGFRADARELGAFLVDEYSDQNAYIGVQNDENDSVRNSRNNNNIQEDTDAVYFQFGTTGEVGGFEVDVLAGLRYEQTDQTSSSDTPPLSHYIWSSDNDFSPVSAPAGTPTVDGQTYDVLLPSLDVSVNLMDDLIGRVSYSETIARPGLSDLGSVVDFGQPNGSTLNEGTTVQATGQNPQLKPLESKNIDVSLEWYFDDASYASVGLFEKRVVNFTGTEITDQTFDVRDQTSGPRAQAAAAALEDIGVNQDNATIYTMMQIQADPDLEPSDFSSGLVSDFNDQDGYEFITPNENDPLMEYEFSTTINNREAKLYGAEFAAQHFFGETGFGVQANYTIVKGDVKFDDLDLTQDQFALLGLSDTANLVLMYENYGFETRLAANWRDKFLNQTGWGSNNPGYVESHTQLDLNVTYNVTDNLAVSFEGINLTGEDRREHGRNENMLIFYDDLGARYQLGARYNF